MKTDSESIFDNPAYQALSNLYRGCQESARFWQKETLAAEHDLKIARQRIEELEAQIKQISQSSP